MKLLCLSQKPGTLTPPKVSSYALEEPEDEDGKRKLAKDVDDTCRRIRNSKK